MTNKYVMEMEVIVTNYNVNEMIKMTLKLQ